MTPKELLDLIADWANDEPNVRGLAVIGSYARGTATADSDLDLVLVCNAPDDLLKNTDWVNRFGKCKSIEVKRYGLVTSIVADYEWGLEVEDGPIVQGASRLSTIAALFWESMTPR